MLKDDGGAKPRNCMMPSCADLSQAKVKKGFHGLPTQPSGAHHETHAIGGVGLLILCDIPMSQQAPLLKSGGANSTWGALKTATRHDILPINHVSVGSLPTAITSGQCDHTSPSDTLSKGCQNLSC